MSEISAQLAAALPLGPVGRPDWFNSLRNSGAEQFRAHGLPLRKDEAWKYTGLGLITQRETRLANVDDLAVQGSGAQPVVSVEHHLNIVNGRFLETSVTSVEGVTVLPLAQAVENDVSGLRDLLESLPASTAKQLSADGFSALNTATLENGLFIHVGAGIEGGRLLLNTYTTANDSARLFNTRICVILGEGASLELLEQFETPHANTNTTNVVLQLELGKGASLQHVRLQQESDETGLITRTEVSQMASSEYSYYGFDLGGGLVRHDLHTSLTGEGARASLNGAYLLDNKRHVDNHARVDHIAPGGFSEQYFRGVAGGNGRAVFNTAVCVHPGADETEALQSNANILLSRRAEIDTKPELEIYADEVVASHGATVGQLDELAVFYLRSRGLNEEQARQILTTAFCRSVSDKLPDRELAEAISQRMMDVMPQTD
jgi:Fe-S cluster assembly protein SufD